MSTPVWLMDVDGVLNAIRGNTDGGTYRFTTARTNHRDYPITYNPEVIERIKALHESGAVEVRWLTTWCDDAERSLGPAIGMPSPLLVEGVSDYRKRILHRGWWKSDAAKRVHDHDPNRWIIWADDHLGWAVGHGHCEWLHSAHKVIPVCPDETTGLTVERIEILEAVFSRKGTA